MAEIQITDMTATNSFPDTAVIAIEDSGTTYKLSGATLAAALKTIGSFLSVSDLKANLTTSTAGSPLDATQGKALYDMITGRITNAIAGSYSTVDDAAAGIWADMSDGTLKIGRFTRGTAWVYFAYRNSANYATMLAITYGQPIIKVDKVNGTVSTQTYSYT